MKGLGEGAMNKTMTMCMQTVAASQMKKCT